MGEVFLYGNGGGTGIGCLLTVTAPSGATVAVSKDDKTKTKIAGSDGVVVFKGLNTGEWTLSITNGVQTASKTVTITADYVTSIDFFKAYINITYPEGSVCTATDGTETMTAPDTSGVWDCVVPNAGNWTVTATDGTSTAYETVNISSDGQSESISISYYFELFAAGKGALIPFSYYKEQNASVSITSDSIKTSYSHTQYCGYLLRSTNKLDLSPYRLLKIELTVGNHLGYNEQYIGVSSNGPTSYTQPSYIVSTKIASTGYKEITLDISKLSSGYFACGSFWYGTITRIVLER